MRPLYAGSKRAIFGLPPTYSRWNRFHPIMSQSSTPIRLGVNVDHCATVRQARYREAGRLRGADRIGLAAALPGASDLAQPAALLDDLRAATDFIWLADDEPVEVREAPLAAIRKALGRRVKGLKMSELCAVTGFTDKQLHRAISALVDEGLVVKSGRQRSMRYVAKKRR